MKSRKPLESGICVAPVKATELAHEIVRHRLGEGGSAVDATVGNGHDTLFLASLAGPGGRVIGFDVQKEAIAETSRRLAEAADRGIALANVTLHQAGHERLREFVAEPLSAVMFNLGYLPGGDKSIVTRPRSTGAGLEQAAALLQPGGIITVVVYTGHPGGEEEARAVLDFCENLPQTAFAIREMNPERAGAPRLIAIEKRE